jgi:geranylgeranyl pyrophosphate synthase/predicted secreted hydrolase
MKPESKSVISVPPPDWPLSGPIDLDIHDLPHSSAAMEWWYVNTHLLVDAGKQFSLFAAFFRVDTSESGSAEHQYSHFLTWGLVDPLGQRFFPFTLLDPQSPGHAVKEFNAGRGPRDERLSQALREVLETGKVPLPDRLFKQAHVDLDRLALDIDGNRFTKQANGSYRLELHDDSGVCGCDLFFTLEKPVVRHGDDGVVRGLAGEDMFYYFSPRCRVEGSVTIDGNAHPVVKGTGWYDHEFGRDRDASGSSERKVGWNWVAAQLDNGYEVSAYDLIDGEDPRKSHGRWVIVVDPSGKRHEYTDFSFEALGCWTSTRTFNEYPRSYRLEVPGAALSLDIVAALPEQEIMTLISPPAFWEGLMGIEGEMHGLKVSGRGFVERSGSSVVDTTDDFFSSVGKVTRAAVERLLPEYPTREQALWLIGGPGREHYVDGIDIEQYSRTVLRPIREIILRGGKAWRSYGVLSCIDLVGGNSQQFVDWLALPELLHVGSLIIDDVQDGSDVRRGGPSCHKLYGDALAINAGCASYFLAQIPVGLSGLSESLRVNIYETYFEAVRAAHAGQALDIDSLTALMPEVVESGKGELLERRVLGTHRLKSAAAPGALARMSALIGGGTREQSEGLGNLFEALGLAFQIVDDVLNLRGFEENRKSHAEDITAGKVTAPVAKAMTRLSLADRRRLWLIIASKPTDRDAVHEAVRLIDDCGALTACEAEARAMVEAAWKAIDPLIPDSQYKVRLRAFGWFVLDRHY